MSTTVQTLLVQLGQMVQEEPSFLTPFWSVDEIIRYINEISREFVLKTQLFKTAAAVKANCGARIYGQNSYASQIDRIAFSNIALDRTNKFALDHGNVKWRSMAGIPKSYHQDQLPIQEFEVDRAPSLDQIGTGYTAIGNYGTVRTAIFSGGSTSSAGMIQSLVSLASNAAVFSILDEGKTVFVTGAGPAGATLITTIASFTSPTQVELAVAASTTVVGTYATWGYLSGGSYGFLRYWYGTPAINGVLVKGRPFSGTLRRMYAGLTNFEVISTRLPAEVSSNDDLLRVPDSAVLYIKYGVLYLMFSKEGEQQDMTRAQYAKARYDRGIELFRKLMGVKTKDAVMAGGRK